MIKTKNKHFGKCNICQNQSQLSREHVPPKCSLNKMNFKLYEVVDVMTNPKLPWENPQYNNQRIKQGGMSYYSICKECNEKTGKFYSTNYKHFITICAQTLYDLNPEPNTQVCLNKSKIKPLNIFKQIISMFNTLNPGLFLKHGVNIKEFLLNVNYKEFCNDINFHIFLTKDFSQQSIQAQHRKTVGTVILSEMVHYPLGVIMCLDKRIDSEYCINDFLNYAYDEEIEIDIVLNFRERKLPIVADFRTKEQIRQAKKKT